MSWRNKLRRLGAMSGVERRLLAEAAVCLALARLLILMVPFRHVAPRLERRPPGSPGGVNPAVHLAIRRAVTTAARHVPWNAVCLPQAMAAKFMLARRGGASTLHLGLVRKEAGGLLAHAWLEVDGAILVGEAGVDAVTPIARFG